MPLPLLAAGISLVPSIFNAIRGGKQRREAQRLRESAVDPGYQMNQGVIDAARRLEDRAVNYKIPGYTRALENINKSYGNAFSQGVQGASSGGDVLDLASKLAYGQGQSMNDLAIQNAQGAERATGQAIDASIAAGQEGVNKNAYDRSRYQQQLAEAAALYNAGETNVANALGDVGSVATSYLMNLPGSKSGRNRKLISPGLGGQTAGFNTANIPTYPN